MDLSKAAEALVAAEAILCLERSHLEGKTRDRKRRNGMNLREAGGRPVLTKPEAHLPSCYPSMHQLSL